MDDGDDYVPQLSQLGQYGGMGMDTVPQQQQQPPTYGMTGGLTPMNNPYEQQQMMMMGGPPQQQQAPPPPQPAPPTKGKGRAKKVKQELDPMQSMAALSNNPMMRPSMQQMGGMYPQQGQMGMYGAQVAPQQSPQYGQPQQGYRPGMPQGYPQHGYPQMQPGMYPQAAAAQQRPPGYPTGQGGPQPNPYAAYPGQAYPQQQAQYPQMRPPQYPGAQPQQDQSQYWSQQQQQQYYGGGMHPMAGGQPQMNDQWGQQQVQQQLYQIEMEIRSMQHRLQQLYQQPRTPNIDVESQQLQHRMQYMQSEHARLMMHSQASTSVPTAGPMQPQQQAAPQHPQQMAPQSSMNAAQSVPGTSGQQVVIQHQQNPTTPATPVQVTQSGSQVQVNIKPETGRTLISVYHQYGEASDDTFGSERKDSVPPEPIPTHAQPPHNLYQDQSQMQQQAMQQQTAQPYPMQQQMHQQQQQQQQQQLQQQQMMSQSQQGMRSVEQPITSVPSTSAQNEHQLNGGVELVNGFASTSNTNGRGDPQQEQAEPEPEPIDEFDIQPKAPPPFNPESEETSQSSPPTTRELDLQETPSEVQDTAEEDEMKPECSDIPSTSADRPPESIDDKDVATPPMLANEAEKEDESEAIVREEVEPTEEDKPTVNEQVDKEEAAEEIRRPSISTSGFPREDDSDEDEEEEREEVKNEEDTVAEEVIQEEESAPASSATTKDEEEAEPTREPTPLESGIEEKQVEQEEEKEVKEEPQEEAIDVDEVEAAPSKSTTPSQESDPTAEPSPATTEQTEQTAGGSEEKEASEVADSTDGLFTQPSTPAATESKKVLKRPAVVRSKKKKSLDDSGDDDDDFIPEAKSRKGVKRTPKAAATGDDGEQKKVSKWDLGEFEDDAEDSILTVDSQDTINPDAQVVEKILNVRQDEAGNDEYLIKWKGKAYIHCEWKSMKELEEADKRVAGKVKRFKQKKANTNTFNDMDEEDFNSDYTIVERVLDVIKGEDDLDYALVKWKSLTYEDVTWEPLDTVDSSKVEVFRERQKIDKMKAKEKARPKPHEWKKMPENLEWKDGNTLREYQFEGVNWLLYCYYNQQNCILADEMGLGKTVQTITFLSQIYEYGIHGPFLIVVPLSTIHNWVREFETWTDMNAVVYHGNAPAREIIQRYELFYSKEHSNGNKMWKKNLVKLDALITTFELVVTDCEFLRKINWKLCVIDEAHRLKNKNCKLLTNGLHAFKMDHRVLLTGTPLQNNIEELFSLLNFLHPQQFSSSNDFLEQFGQCQSDDQVQKLQEILKPMMLRRLKEDVEKTLQPKQETIIEVQLSDTQKKYYRAILERNFSHLCKGVNAPSLMNVMMELRKCCNHPFLIQGAEETILSEMRLLHPEWDDETLMHRGLVQASGKVVLIEKLLPKLRKDGHKVLIFSQMVKVLDLLEEFLINMNYPFERIDGNVRGDMRQASIDRFSKKDSDRFVFLLCTRAGGLGINLTAADTVIIFDSDWNPQNDLQAQARCHRIGQTKMVKVYRLVTANTYEREMFDKASLKLGLDKAVLQSTTALEKSSTALSKKDVEELLKKGAYGSIMDESNEGSKFSEEDIETILQRRTTTITLEAGQKGSLFSKATFNSSNNKGDDIDLDDPNFWTKWAEKAQVDIEKATATTDGRELIIQEPRKRTKRFEENSLKEGEDSDGSEENGKGGRKRDRNAQNSARKRRRGDEDDGDYINYRPDELAFNKSEYFKVEKVLGSWGWGRWAEMKKSGELEVSEMDIEHMARTLLLHCIREYRGDERTRLAVWTLIAPVGGKNAKEAKGGHSIYHQGWAALPEYNPPNFALDASFQRHVHRHANKLLTKIDLLKHMEKEIIGTKAAEIDGNADWTTIDIRIPTLAEQLCDGWDADCDKCLIIGIHRHGLEALETLREDKLLCFGSKNFVEPNPNPTDMLTRFKKLIAASQRNVNDPVYDRLRWSRREELEFMRVLRAFGMKDKKEDTTQIDWNGFRALSPALEKKSDSELQEYLYCILAMCTSAAGGELSALDRKRANSVDMMSQRRSQKLMNRLHLTRKVHAMVTAGLDNLTNNFKMCSNETMPNGWNTQHDKELITVCDQYGIDNISQSLLQKPAFQKIIRPNERTLLRRVVEVCTTVESGKWNGKGSIDGIEDSDTEEKEKTRLLQLQQQQQQQARRGRKRTAADSEAKMMQQAMMQQAMLSQAHQFNDATLKGLMQASLMSQLLTNMAGGNAATTQAIMSTLLGMDGSASSSSASSSMAAAAALALAAAAAPGASTSTADPDALNLTKSKAPARSPAPVASTSSSALASSLALPGMPDMGLNDLLLLASLPADTRIPMINNATKAKLPNSEAPILNDLAPFMAKYPQWSLDMVALGKALASAMESPSTSAKPSAPPTPKPATPALSLTPLPATPVSKAPTPAPSTTPSANSPKLEPGEIPKKGATVTVNITAGTPITPLATSTTPLPTSSPTGQTAVAVFNRTTGAVLPAAKWPTLSEVNDWLDSNPEANVHSSSIKQELMEKISAAHLDRLGGDPDSIPSTSSTIKSIVSGTTGAPQQTMTPSSSKTSNKEKSTTNGGETSRRSTTGGASSSSSTSSADQKLLEQMQMQMMMQQALLQQSLLGGYSFMTSGNQSTKPDDVMNQLTMMSLLASNPAAALAMMDPSVIAALNSQMGVPGTSSNSASSSSKKSKAPPST